MKLAFGIVSTLFFSPPSPAHRPPVFPASIRLRARTQTARPIRGPLRSLPPAKTRVASVGRPAKHDLGGNLHAQRSFAAGYTLGDSIRPVVYQIKPDGTLEGLWTIADQKGRRRGNPHADQVTRFRTSRRA